MHRSDYGIDGACSQLSASRLPASSNGKARTALIRMRREPITLIPNSIWILELSPEVKCSNKKGFSKCPYRLSQVLVLVPTSFKSHELQKIVLYLLFLNRCHWNGVTS